MASRAFSGIGKPRGGGLNAPAPLTPHPLLAARSRPAESNFLSVLLMAAVLAAASQAVADTVQWSGNGHFYEVVSVPGGISWDDTNAAAISAGGYLATITSQQENDFVFSLVDNPLYWTYFHSTYEGPWLGGYQYPATTTPTANWKWVTGESWVYTNWAPGQPNDNGGSEDKLNYYGVEGRTSGWNDIRSIDPLGKPIAYVVESVPEPSTLVLLGVGAIGLVGHGLRRRGDGFGDRIRGQIRMALTKSQRICTQYVTDSPGNTIAGTP